MSPRRLPVLALAAAAFACTEVKQDGAPEELVTVALYSPPRDPANCGAPVVPNIPLPNDVALQRAPGLPAGLQKELLLSFIGKGGWPSDQVTPITLPVYRRTRDATTGSYVAAAGPAGIDTATLNDGTVALLQVNGDQVTRLPFTASYVPPAAGAAAGTPGTIRIVPSSGRWPAGGRFVAAIRGGANGVKTSTGVALGADTPIGLIAPDKDLSIQENQPLGAIPDSACSPSGNADEIQTLERLRAVYGQPQQWGTITSDSQCALGGIPVAPCWLPGVPPAGTPSAFDAVATVFPHEEIASIQTFVTQSGTAPVTDAAGGTVPLPSDFLLDPTTGKVRNVPAFGPAAAGLATLDGFSTTATHLIPMSGPVAASSVTANSLHIYDLATGAPVKLHDQTALPGNAPQIVTQPPQFNVDAGGGNFVATTLALAPAAPLPVPTAVSPSGVFAIPPLEEKNRYLVLVTNDVLDASGGKLQRSTLMDILFTFETDIYDDKGTADPADDVNNAAGLGISNADAAGLQAIREGLTPALTLLGLKDCSNGARCAAVAYTVTTQSIKETALQLSAAPYGIEQAAGQAVFDVVSATDVTGQPGVPTIPGVAKVVQVTFRSYDGIDKTTGAFRPTLAAELDPAAWAPSAKPDPTTDPNVVELSAYLTVPSTIAGSCPAGYPGGAACAPLAVVGHGLNGSKTTVFATAAELAARGYIGVATDFPLHGDRNWCGANADCVVPATGVDGTCDKSGAFAGSAGQGDSVAPGVCSAGSVPKTAASRYFVSANFFRIRDAFRQNLFDQSALILALARQLPAAPLAGVLPANTYVDPRQAHYLGVSLGSISGTSVVATNPRITRASFDVGGGSFVDIAINAPAFRDQLEPLFAGLIPGFTWEAVDSGDPAFNPSVAASYAQLVSVAKWVLDPGDPINFASNVELDPLPNLLSPTPALQPPKPSYGQVAFGDTVVPNPQNFLLYQLIGADVTEYDSDRPEGTDASGIAYEANSIPHGIFGILPPAGPQNPAEYVAAGAQVRADATDWLIGITPPTSRTFDLTP